MKLKMLKERLAAIGVSLKALQGKTEYTEDDKTQLTALQVEAKSVQESIKMEEELEKTLNSITNTPVGTQVPQSQPGADVRVVKNSFEDSTGFKTPGHFFMAIREKAYGKDNDKLNLSIYTRDDEGGLLVPTEIGQKIDDAVAADGSLFALTTKLKCSGNSFSHPVDNKRPWNSGISVYFAGEGTTMTKSDLSALDAAELKLRKMYAYSEVSNESLEDAAGLQSWLNAKAPGAIVQKMNEMIISGSGVAMPQGLLNSNHLLTVAAETQAAGSVVTANILKMLAARIPGGKYVWLYNPKLQYHLETLVDPNGNYIFLAAGSQLNQSGYDRLRGLPLIPMMGGVKAAGSPGDLLLVDLNSGYETLSKSGSDTITSSVSPHIAFDKDKMAFKWTIRWDGKCPFNSTVTNQTSDATLSYLIALATRAG